MDPRDQPSVVFFVPFAPILKFLTVGIWFLALPIVSCLLVAAQKPSKTWTSSLWLF
jgi:hypothetical protein